MRAWILSLYLLATAVVSMVALIQVFPQTSHAAVQVTRVDSAKASVLPSSKASDGDPAATAADPSAGTGGESGADAKVAEWTVLDELIFGEISIAGFRFRPAKSSGQGLIVLAVLAGILGSFMHAAQSLTSYVGNKTFKASWELWYILRAPVGAVLGAFLYFVMRAGLLTTNTNVVSPYGVVAIAGLGGWFSKQATDKLAEIFDQFFASRSDSRRDDKLDAEGLMVASTAITTQGDGSRQITLEGDGFKEGMVVILGSLELPAVVVSGKAATVVVPSDAFGDGSVPKTLTVRLGEQASPAVAVDL